MKQRTFIIILFASLMAITSFNYATTWSTDTNSNTDFNAGDFNYTYVTSDGNLTVTGQLDWNHQKTFPDQYDANLIGYWTFNDKSGRDGNSTHIFNKAYGTTANKCAKYACDANYNNGADNNALGMWDTNAGFFDGVNDFAVIPTNLYSNKTYTTGTFWVYIDSYPSTNVGVVHAWMTGESQIAYDVNTGGYFEFWINGALRAASPNPVGTKKWISSAWVTDGTNVKIYIDGVQVDSRAFSSAVITSSQAIYLFRRSDNAGAGNYLTGKVDDVKIYDRNLSATEIQQDFNAYWSRKYSGLSQSKQFASYSSKVFDANSVAQWSAIKWTEDFNYGGPDRNAPQKDSSLVGYWSFDRQDLNVTNKRVDQNNIGVIDLAGQDNNGQMFGGDTNGTGIFNDVNGAGFFDGVDDGMIVPNRSTFDFGSGGFTIGGWFKFANNTKGYQFLLDGRSGVDQTGWVFYTETNNNLSFLTASGSSWDCTVLIGSSTTFIPDVGVWTQIIVTKVGNVLTLYKNGIPVKSGVCNTSVGAQTVNLTIGRGHLSDTTLSYAIAPYTGLMDEVRIYNRGLSEAEVQRLYAQGLTDVKFQVRSCDDANCVGESFVGLDGTANTYFQEHNISYTLPSQVGNNRYFQWKAFFDSNFNADINHAIVFPRVLDVNVDYSSNLPVSIKTTLNGKPKSFFGLGQTARILVNYVTGGVADSISIWDGNGINRVNGASLTALTGNDANYAYYDFQVVGAIGWYQVRIGTTDFNNVFYQGEVWQSAYVNSDGVTFPFRFDLNVQAPTDINRWFSPIDSRIDFNYNSAWTSVRVLDYNDANYLEIPSQVYDANIVSNYAKNARIFFLTDFNSGERKTFFINYTNVDKNKVYGIDLNSKLNWNNILFENSLLKAQIDLNKGGGLMNVWNKQSNSSSNDLNGNNPMQLSPEAKSGPTTYAITSYSPTTSFDVNGSLIKKYKVYGTVSAMDYNISYTFFAKKPYFLMDINAKPRLNETWSYYYDSYFFGSGSKFNRFVYKIGSIAESVVTVNGTGSNLTGLADLNYLGLYNQSTYSGLGTIFLNRTNTRAYSPTIDFYDSTNNEYWFRTFYSGTVATSDLFTSRQALALFSAANNFTDLNFVWWDLNHPVTLSVGRTSTSDTTIPYFSQTFYTPKNPTDNNQIRCFADVNDNLQVSTVDLNVRGPDFNIQSTFTVNDLNSSLSYDFNANAGTFDCNWTIYDIAGNKDSNTVRFSVKDNNAPKIRNVYSTPDTNALLDPSTVVRVDVNLTEYSGFGDVNVLWRRDVNGSYGDWNYLRMSCSSVSDYNSDCNASFVTPSIDSNIQYKVRAKDVNGFDANSSTKLLFSYSDYTWIINRQSFGTVSGNLDKNVNLGLIDINNTGDNSLAFLITSNWFDKSKILYSGTTETASGYSFSLASGAGITLDVNVGTPTSERSDDLNIVINPSTAQASPDLNNATATVTSNAGGPFMFVEITDYNLSVSAGGSASYIGKVTNRGNMDANNVFLTWILPSGWTVSSGTDANLRQNLTQTNSLTSNITVSIASTASSGTQVLTFKSGCCGNVDKNQSTSVNVAVNSASTTTTTTTTTTTNASSGGGTGFGSGGGSGSSIFKTAEEKNAFFKSTELIELLRGKQTKFLVKISNPLKEKLLNLQFNVFGYMSKYLNVEPKFLNELDSNQSIVLRVELTAPAYFSKGLYDLNFNITGLTEKNVNFSEERLITLQVHDSTKKEAMDSLQKAREIIDELKKAGIYTVDFEELLHNAVGKISERDYETAVSAANQLIEFKNQYVQIQDTLKTLEFQIAAANAKGINVDETKKLVSVIKAAAQRGEFETALMTLKDAEATFALETKGEFNAFVILSQNWPIVLVAIIVLGFALLSFYFYERRQWLKKKLNLLENEESLILLLIKDEQEQCFKENKHSITQYFDAVQQHEKRLTKVVGDIVKYETMLRNLFAFLPTKKLLEWEKIHILKLMKSLQSNYFEQQNIDARIYDAKQSVLLKRLGEIEEKLAEHDLEKQLRIKGKMGFVWKILYKKE